MTSKLSIEQKKTYRRIFLRFLLLFGRHGDKRADYTSVVLPCMVMLLRLRSNYLHSLIKSNLIANVDVLNWFKLWPKTMFNAELISLTEMDLISKIGKKNILIISFIIIKNGYESVIIHCFSFRYWQYVA